MATQQKLNPNFVMYMHRTISDTYQKHETIIHRPFTGKSDKLKQQGTQFVRFQPYLENELQG